MENKNFEYDSELDSLTIYNHDGSEQIKGSIVVNNLIFDVGFSGKILSLEVENASEFLNLDYASLSKITEAKLKILTNGNVGTRVFDYKYILPQNRIAMRC
jgi:uncharacterized protein YuzE